MHIATCSIQLSQLHIQAFARACITLVPCTICPTTAGTVVPLLFPPPHLFCFSCVILTTYLLIYLLSLTTAGHLADSPFLKSLA